MPPLPSGRTIWYGPNISGSVTDPGADGSDGWRDIVATQTSSSPWCERAKLTYLRGWVEDY